MEGLGALGFWLMVGMVLAAGTVSQALKERDKERERQAMLRALLEKGDEGVTEVLAYMRERDAAEAAASFRALWGMEYETMRGLFPVAEGILAFVGVVATGYFAGVALRFGVLRDSESAIPFLAMFGIWATAPIAAWRVWRSAKQKHDAHPDA
jgi:hypothetical protein